MSFPVSIHVNADRELGPLRPIYRYFGADEPNYAYMKDGEKLLRKLGELGPEQVFFRAHSLLVTGDGTPALKWGSTNAYTEDENGNPIYNWKIIDHIFDTYLERNIKPYVQIGFTPEAMSTHPQPYQHTWTPHAKYHEIFTGWAYPPKDFKKWEELVYQCAKHSVEKYGLEEVQSWYWEIWNEPNIGYWQGTPEEFYALHGRCSCSTCHSQRSYRRPRDSRRFQNGQRNLSARIPGPLRERYQRGHGREGFADRLPLLPRQGPT